MLLLSNLSLQILDSKNKQRDQSSRLLQANVSRKTPLQHCPEAENRSTGRYGWMDGWMAHRTKQEGVEDDQTAAGGIRGQMTEFQTLLPALSDPLLWPWYP